MKTLYSLPKLLYNFSQFSVLLYLFFFCFLKVILFQRSHTIFYYENAIISFLFSLLYFFFPKLLYNFCPILCTPLSLFLLLSKN